MNPKDRVGATKPPLSFLPCRPLFEAGAVCEGGAAKYGPHNWRDSPITASAYYNAALRHLMAWWEGEDLDPESGQPHVAHVIAGLCILRDAQLHGTYIEDRPPASEPGWLEQLRVRSCGDRTP